MSTKDALNQIGGRFGKLTIIGIGSKDSEIQQVHRKYECRCDCGNKIFVSLNDLKNEHVKMCPECANQYGKFFYMGNIKKHPLYRRARGVYERCNFKTNHEYYNYGGRGIKCELGNSPGEVAKSLEKVPGYFDKAQIDRVDNNGNYTLWHPVYGYNIWYDDHGNPCLGNLRWATQKENANNTRNNVSVEDLKVFPRRMEKIKEVLFRNKLTLDDVKLIKSDKHSIPGHPKYYVVLLDEANTFIPKEEPDKDPKTKYREDRVKEIVNHITSNRFYNIAKNILDRCNNPRNTNYRLYGGIGIRCELGTNIRQVMEALEKVPGYEPDLFIDRTEPLANFSLVHPIHGKEIWIDEQGYQCLGTMRWVRQADQQVRKIVNEENRLSIESLAKIPRPLNNLIATIKRNFNLNDFIFITVDNSNMSHLHETLYIAMEKSKANNVDLTKY